MTSPIVDAFIDTSNDGISNEELRNMLNAERQIADAAQQKLDAAQQELEAVRQRADAERQRADAAQQKLDEENNRRLRVCAKYHSFKDILAAAVPLADTLPIDAFVQHIRSLIQFPDPPNSIGGGYPLLSSYNQCFYP